MKNKLLLQFQNFGRRLQNPWHHHELDKTWNAPLMLKYAAIAATEVWSSPLHAVMNASLLISFLPSFITSLCYLGLSHADTMCFPPYISLLLPSFRLIKTCYGKNDTSHDGKGRMTKGAEAYQPLHRCPSWQGGIRGGGKAKGTDWLRHFSLLWWWGKKHTADSL